MHNKSADEKAFGSKGNNLPVRFFDAHHHFLDTKANGTSFQVFLASLMPETTYLPDHYYRDVIAPLNAAGIEFLGSVHVECLPDDGYEEAKWVLHQSCACSSASVKGIVASFHLGRENTVIANKELEELAAIPHVKGIRWILDCVGKYEGGKTATHVATIRHDGIDFLRGSEGGYDGRAIPSFERGFALLASHQLTFDLQCAPAQLLEAANLCSRHPSVKVVIDHLGKPRMLLGPDSNDDGTAFPDERELAVWREGMRAMASNENVYVKISMLGYAVPGWVRSLSRINLIKSLVQETVKLFGPHRCMVATNFFQDPAFSDSGGESLVGPTPLEFLELVYSFLKQDYTEKDLDFIFASTAMEFYGIV
ncbi:amidohydrolase family protein [Nitzschia inconspicua]|uniref:Amidohydrolase family protein n=1 Tax=Nitzschia inconspicua TaxID=303405 RepID=A0A9K3KM57_9STRA|nr:amidohydrolase family protein [Nitzschia inconspicua]